MFLLAGNFLGTFFDIILFLVALGVLVAVHEFGHFIAAKIFHVYVSEFSIGFGPLIFKKKKGETMYSLRALPLGGFCAMAGEGNEEIEEFKDLPKERTLQGISKWKRAIIMIAGVTLNFVLAFFLFVGYFGTTTQIDMSATRVTLMQEEGKVYPLEASGYQGENITNITYVYFEADGEDAVSSKLSFDVTDGSTLATALSGGYFTNEDGTSYYYSPAKEDSTKTLTITVEGGTTYTAVVPTKVASTSGQDDIQYTWDYIGAKKITYHMNFWEVMSSSASEVGSASVMILKAFGTLFTSEGINSLGGPISVFKVSSEASSYGFGYFVLIWGLISCNLGVFNLLPFPGLDGWHFIVIIFEGITHKEMPQKAKNVASMIGLGLLFLLMIVVTVKDIIGLF